MARGVAKALVMFGLMLTGVASAQMSTPSSFRVNETGAAVYEIPIKVPPGVAGVEPKLSLVYNSQSGNGLLGVGWSLQGLSSITRCPRTMAQDGVRGGVNYDTNDRYCLDGQRLMAISGTYGADGTEYRTERESFTKVISYGTAGNGPSYFKAWTKSGQIIEYGNTVDSKIEAQGKSTVRVWAVNKIQDTKGNFLTATYTEDNVNGDFYPSRIDYTANTGAGLAANQSVRFTYQGRTDSAALYVGGSMIKLKNRLANVKTYAGETMLIDYRLAYQYADSTKRSRLISLTECDVANSCLPVSSLAWQEPGQPSYGWNWSSPTAMVDFSNPIYYVDVNGDGKADLVARGQSGNINDGKIFVALSDGTGYPAWTSITSPLVNPGDEIYFADVNGDGKTDLIMRGAAQYPYAGQIHVNLSTGTGYSSGGVNNGWTSITSILVNPGDEVYFSDVSGDGRADLIMRGAAQYPYAGQIYVNLSTGTGYTSGGVNNGWISITSQLMNPGDEIYFVDVNGDNMTDLVMRGATQYPYAGQIHVNLSTGSGYNSGGINNGWSSVTSPLVNPGDELYFGDVNGDGKADLIMRGASQYPYWGGIFVNLSTGVGYSSGGVNNGWTWISGGPMCNPGDQLYIADVNGDGRADLILRGAQQYGAPYAGAISVSLSEGTIYSLYGSGFAAGWNWRSAGSIIDASNPLHFVDVNGDGKADMITKGQSGNINDGKIFVALSPGVFPDLMTSMTGGLNAVTSATYRPITNNSYYAKESNAVYPQLDIQAPFYVVSSQTSSNGIGGSVQTNYFYTGLKAELGTGRGLLGFKQVNATDVSTGGKGQMQYRQDWPYVGLSSQSKRIAPDGMTILSRGDQSYACIDPASGAACTIVACISSGSGMVCPAAGNRYFPYASQTDETNRDLNDTFISKVRTTSTYDALGNATQIGVTHLDEGGSSLGYSKTTTNTYINDTTNWFLGRLIRSEVQSVAP